MKCPICKKPVSIDDPYMPFCSKRCQLIDLANWLDGKYVISTPIEVGSEPALPNEKECEDEEAG